MTADSQLSAAALHHRPLTLAGLRGFEAAARHLSLTRAANELNLTQSAVSRQVQGLEEELGVTLFVRKAREILLTAEGAQFLSLVQRSLVEIDAGVERLRRDAFSPRISLNTFASFASLWLIPRLPAFRAIKPNVDIDVGATDRLVDIELENVDVAIRYLSHGTEPEGAELLLDEFLYPIMSPTYLDNAPPLRSVADLKKHTLIECKWGGLAEQPAQWSRFLEALDETSVRGRSQLKFDFIVQALMAAQGGQGVALARTYGADMLMGGQLVRALDVSIASATGCYLVVSPRGAARPEVRAFVDWLRAEVATFNKSYTAWLKQSGVDAVKPKGKSRKS